MAISDLIKQGAKQGAKIVSQELGLTNLSNELTFIPDSIAFGRNSDHAACRHIANELESNYQLAKAQVSAVTRSSNRRIALCIGCNYPHYPKNGLNACVNDAMRWSELLSRNYGFETFLMTDNSLKGARKNWDDPSVPTLPNLINTLKRIITGMKRGDCLFISFSGHGTRVRDGDGDEGDGYDECLVLPDPRRSITNLVDDVLYRECIRHVPAGCKVTAVFDCCRSGGAMDLDWEINTHRDARTGATSVGKWHRDNQRNKWPCKGDVTLISGCASAQVSLEVGGGGILSTVMIKLLSRQPYGWSYEAFLKAVIENVFKSTLGQRSQTVPQLPTLSSSVPFDVTKRMWGPDQLTGIMLPEKNMKLNPEKTMMDHEPLEATQIPSYMKQLFKKIAH